MHNVSKLNLKVQKRTINDILRRVGGGLADFHDRCKQNSDCCGHGNKLSDRGW